MKIVLDRKKIEQWMDEARAANDHDGHYAYVNVIEQSQSLESVIKPLLEDAYVKGAQQEHYNKGSGIGTPEFVVSEYNYIQSILNKLNDE